MAIKVSGTTVIDDNRNITDVENFGDSNTVYFGNGSNLSGAESGISTFVASGAISNGDTVIINADGTVSAVTISGTTNLTTENYIGIAAEAISNGAIGKITVIGGINTAQSGLTTARTYYVQNNGSLGLTSGNPSVVAGTSVSSTEIIVR